MRSGSLGLSSLGLLLIATQRSAAEYTDGYPDCGQCDECSGCYELQEEFSVPCGWKHTGSDTAVSNAAPRAALQQAQGSLCRKITQAACDAHGVPPAGHPGPKRGHPWRI